MVALTSDPAFVAPYHVALGLAFVALLLSPPTLRTLGHIDPSFVGKGGQLTGLGRAALFVIFAGLLITYVFAWLQAGWSP